MASEDVDEREDCDGNYDQQELHNRIVQARSIFPLCDARSVGTRAVGDLRDAS